MKAITLWRPWSSFVAFELKPIETRTHNRFRSLAGKRIAIHAGQRRVEIDWMEMHKRYIRDVDLLQKVLAHSLDHAGCVVAVVDVKAHRQLTDADSAAALYPAEGLFGLDLASVRRFREPIPATEQQWTWDWEPPENWETLLTD